MVIGATNPLDDALSSLPSVFKMLSIDLQVGAIAAILPGIKISSAYDRNTVVVAAGRSGCNLNYPSCFDLFVSFSPTDSYGPQEGRKERR